MKSLERLILALIAISVLICVPMVSADNTLRGKRLKVSADARDAASGIIAHEGILCDTLYNPSRDSVQIAGYDKPLRTYRETLLLTNATARDISGLAITVTYIDMQQRQLHARTDTLCSSVPSGETRMIHLSTWDKQHSYYYHRGQRPRTANVTPYDVKCHIDFIVSPKI